MPTYEEIAKVELAAWKKNMIRKPSITKTFANKLQKKVNEKIPEKAHQVVTTAIKKMVEATLTGSAYTTKVDLGNVSTFEDREGLVKERLQFYRKLAVAEGAGTGAGGILLGLADFPLLLTIKMKFLMECAQIYGKNINDINERIFLLYVFQLAFSSVDHRKKVLSEVENWEKSKAFLQEDDWRKLQLEYRDHIDLVKLLQLIPGFGAIVGAYANHQLLDELGEAAFNCFRIRLLQ